MRLAILLSAACSAATATPSAQLAEPRASHTATALADGTILVAGGFRKDGTAQIYTATTELVDGRGHVRAGPPLVEARAGHVAIALRDGRVVVAGGWGPNGMLRSAEIYDPARKRFTRIADLAEPRGAFAATLLADGRVLVTGGGDGIATRSAELFDPRTDRFQPTGAMSEPRLAHTATLLADGRVLVTGGSPRAHDVLASAELYDPRTGAFTPTGALASARYKHAALRLPDGKVLVVGGSDARDWRGRIASTELYDPQTARFAAGPALTEPRFKLPNAVAIVGDDVVVAGGGDTVERVRVGAASRLVERLGEPRFYPTATRLDGMLVIIGGYDEHARVHRDIWTIRL